MKAIKLTTKQTAVLKTLLKNDIREMRCMVVNIYTRPEDEAAANNIRGDIAENEGILRLLGEGKEGGG